MAIYHLSVQVISRKKGQSAVAAAAYRSGERLKDERTDETKFYKRDVQPETMIIAPSHSPEWVYNRERLWNEVEKSETRINSRLAREINIALPVELSNEQQKELITNYVQNQFVNQGMIADVAIHRDDSNNPHAHVMLTTREITADGFGKKNREWNDKRLLEEWREEWANHANQSLEKANSQERISHLSHEARGLEILPTVHLGHVAHGMEQKGIQTELGNINRERQEYNAVVIDLQKYREEKEALQREMARKQEQKEQEERFYTETERTHLKAAAHLLNADPSFSNIEKKRKELDERANQLEINAKHLETKDRNITRTAYHYDQIRSLRKKIKAEQQKIADINWFNVFKVNENKAIGKKAEKRIENAKEDIVLHKQGLDKYREKFGFQKEKEFQKLQNQWKKDHPELLEQIQRQKEQVRHEQMILEKAQNALERAFVRKLAVSYPECPEMRYMTFQNTQKLDQLNRDYEMIIPIETIQQSLDIQKQDIQQLTGTIESIEANRSRLDRVKGYMQQYQESSSIIKKYEENPFLKGKTLVSNKAKTELDNAVSSRSDAIKLMKQESVFGRESFDKQLKDLEKMEAHIPKLEAQIKTKQENVNLFDSIIRGMNQARWDMLKEQSDRKPQKTIKKQRTRGHDGMER